MTESQVLPEGLVGLPPGPELGAALASVDLTRCSSVDVHTVLVLQSKQFSYEQARLWDVMLETGYAQSDQGADPSSRVRELDEFSASQAAFSLTWSRVATSRQLELARDLIERLPMVYEAVRAGRIDPVRAVVFSKALRGVDDETARAIAAGLIEKAERWTAGQLGERLRYRVLKADPSLAKKRYQQSVADRRVFFRPYLDGTAEMGAVNLPPHLAAAAFDRINRLAKAAYAAGDVRTLNQLRADAYLDLLIGKQFQFQPSTDPLTREPDAAGRADGIGLEGDCGDDPIVPRERRQPQNRPASGFWARRGDTKATRDGARHNPHDLQDQPDPNRAQRANNTGSGYRFAAPGPGTGPGTGPGANSSGYRSPGPDPETEPIGAAGFDPTDVDPPPPDPPPPDLLPPDQASPAPDPVVRGSDDPRMCTCGGIQPAPRRGQVDIHIEASTLMCLNDNPGLIPGWGPVLADIARLVAFDEENNPAWKFTVTDSRGVPTHHGHTTRRPNAKEKAFVKARDKTCKAPGCRQPAMHCDDDHRYEWVRGGPPTAESSVPCAATIIGYGTNEGSSSTKSGPEHTCGKHPTGDCTSSSPTATSCSPPKTTNAAPPSNGSSKTIPTTTTTSTQPTSSTPTPNHDHPCEPHHQCLACDGLTLAVRGLGRHRRYAGARHQAVPGGARSRGEIRQPDWSHELMANYWR